MFDIPAENQSEIQPPSWRANQLESKYECELIGSIPSKLFSMCWAPRAGKPVLDVLNKVVSPYNKDSVKLSSMPDFIVMGHHGRKGPKAMNTSLGSTTDQALRLRIRLNSLSCLY